jgi:hypothetical protein
MASLLFVSFKLVTGTLLLFLPDNQLRNGPFTRRIVHVHIGDVPVNANSTVKDSSGSSRAFLQGSIASLLSKMSRLVLISCAWTGLGISDIRCVRVDREVDEQGYLPYKLLTVPYTRAAELAPEVVLLVGGTDTDDVNGAHELAGASNSAWDTEEHKAAADLAQYVLTPAQLHLWGFPAAPGGLSGAADGTDEKGNVGDKRGAAADSDDSSGKRARTELSTDGDATRQLARGGAADCLPTTHSEAERLLRSVGLPVGTATVGTESLAVQYSTLPRQDRRHAALWEGVPQGSDAPRRVQVAAVDCEMCVTAVGVELTRVSLLAHDGSLLLDALVKPAADILDYKTQFSGISEEMLSGVTTTLAQVKCPLLLAAALTF